MPFPSGQGGLHVLAWLDGHARLRVWTPLFAAMMFSMSNHSFFKLLLNLVGLGERAGVAAIGLYLFLDLALGLHLLKLYLDLRGRAVQRCGTRRIGVSVLALSLLFFAPFAWTRDLKAAAIELIFALPFILVAGMLAASRRFRGDFLRAFLRLRYVYGAFGLAYLLDLLFLAQSSQQLFPDFSYGNVALFFLPPALIYYYLFIFDPVLDGSEAEEEEPQPSVQPVRSSRPIRRGELLVLAVWLSVMVIYTGLRSANLALVSCLPLAAVAVFLGAPDLRKRNARSLGLAALALSLSFVIGLTVYPVHSRVEVFHIYGLIYERENHTKGAAPDRAAAEAANAEEGARPGGEAEDAGKPAVIPDRRQIAKEPVYNVALAKETRADEAFFYYFVHMGRDKAGTEALLKEDLRGNRGQYLRASAERRALLQHYEPVYDRVNLWNLALAEIRRSPVVGQGVRYFQLKYDGFFPHNCVLEVAVDFGLVGLAIFAGLFLFLFVRAVRRLRCLRDGRIQVPLLFALSYLPLFLLYTSLYQEPNLQFLLTLLTGLALLTCPVQRGA